MRPATSSALPVAAPTLNVNAPSIGMRVDGDDVPVDDVRAVVELGQAGDDDRVGVAVLGLADAADGCAVAVEQLHRGVGELHALAERQRHGVRWLPGRQFRARLGAGALELGVRGRGSGRGEHRDQDEARRGEDALHAASGRSGLRRCVCASSNHAVMMPKTASECVTARNVSP